MFERFTDRSRRVVVLAQKEARDSGSETIHTEHLLLAIIAERAGRAMEALNRSGVTEDAVRSACSIFSAGVSKDHLAFTTNAKRALEMSLREALQQGSSFIDAEHLLLGLTGFDCGAARYLDSAGVDLPVLREQISVVSATPATFVSPQQHKGGSKRKTLEAFGTNMTAAAREGLLDPVVGRDSEIERVVQILCRRTKGNPVLVGPAGVGKTAVAEGLAQLLASGKVPDLLDGVELWNVDLGSMVAGTRFRGDFEERIKDLVKDASHGDVILFIDEIHSMLGTGSSDNGGISTGDILKPALARGEIKLLGATTREEYRKLEKDKALERRMAPVDIDEPTPDTTLLILDRLRPTYEDFHHLVVSDDALKAAVTLTVRYVGDRRLPDKAIDAIDEAMARVRLTGPRGVEEVTAARTSVAAVAAKVRSGSANADDKATEASALEVLESHGARWEVTDADIADVVSAMANVPISVDGVEADRLLHLEDHLHERIVGQHQAVREVARALRRSRAGLAGSRRVTGSFLFVGPTGVGKTELARAVSDVAMGRPDALIQIDMSEYMESHSVSRLIGSPPGYVGHGEGGQLTEAVRRNPWSVVLFDEIEKAHPDVLNVLLQLLDEGRLTDAEGRKVDFSNTVVIMTSNIGTELLGRNAVGFGKSDSKSDERLLLEAVRKTLRPELIGRIDEIIAFHALDTAQVSEIARSMVAQVALRLADSGIALEVTEAAYDVLVNAGFDPSLGARPMRRAVQQLVENRLANALLDGTVAAGQMAILDSDDPHAKELTVTSVELINEVTSLTETTPA